MGPAKHDRTICIAADVSYDRPMARDIGGYFEQMTRKARGGRRLHQASEADLPESGATGDESTPTPARTPASGGGLGEMLKDVLRKGRTTATTSTKSAAEKARERITRNKRATRPRPKRAAERTRLPPEGVVTVEYSPRLDGDPDPGEVVWTWVPFEEDPEQGKDRPVVVIGRRNQGLVGVPLTTKHNDREAQIAIGTGDWDPKRRPSYARIWRMLDIDEHRTRREGAVLERDRFDDVIAAVDRYYEIRRPKPATTSDDAEYDY
jgi:hypothetical protein